MEKYAFIQKLGQGSFAVVWKARRKSDSRLVAVKQLKQSPESWEACKQLPEVRAAAAIADRRNVVGVLEAVRHGGELFLVFEHVEGSLHACVALGQRIEESQIRWAARRLLMGLSAVHAAGLVHCDIKPENILVGAESGSCGEPVLKLCDFGQAGPPDQIGTYVGTRWYRPPELLLGARGDQAVDLWAAGCVIAELVLRRPLFPGTDTRDMLFRICGELGAPENQGEWPLAARMVEASGRPNAPTSDWQSLEEAGFSKAGVAFLASLLKYNGSERARADRALREAAFFASGTSEAPITVPPDRPTCPETLRRNREEATAVERRLRAVASSPGPGCAAAAQETGSSSQVLPQLPAATSPVPSASGTNPSVCIEAVGRGCSKEASVPPPRRRFTSSEDMSPGGVFEGGSTSDNEALAEAFWDACKAGRATSATCPVGTDTDEQAVATAYVAGVSDASSRRARRPNCVADDHPP